MLDKVEVERNMTSSSVGFFFSSKMIVIQGVICRLRCWEMQDIMGGNVCRYICWLKVSDVCLKERGKKSFQDVRGGRLTFFL